jgi:hypothetical protein
VANAQNPHAAALGALIPLKKKAAYERRVKALVARNKLLTLLESVQGDK